GRLRNGRCPFLVPFLESVLVRIEEHELLYFIFPHILPILHSVLNIWVKLSSYLAVKTSQVVGSLVEACFALRLMFLVQLLDPLYSLIPDLLVPDHVGVFDPLDGARHILGQEIPDGFVQLALLLAPLFLFCLLLLCPLLRFASTCRIAAHAENQ